MSPLQAIAAMLRWFDHDHLPPHLADVVKPYRALAQDLAHGVHGGMVGPELTVALRKLLESKDAAVRARLSFEDAP